MGDHRKPLLREQYIIVKIVTREPLSKISNLIHIMINLHIIISLYP